MNIKIIGLKKQMNFNKELKKKLNVILKLKPKDVLIKNY